MDMTSLNISLPEGLKAYIEEQARVGGYSTVSEFVRDLVRADQRRKAEDRLVALLLPAVEELNRGEGAEVTPEFWEGKWRLLNDYVAKKARG